MLNISQTMHTSYIIVNIYKPPNIQWPQNVLPVYDDPCVYTGDMNCHNTLWGYNYNDKNGDDLLDWSINNGMELIFDPKDKKSFYSKAHQTETNPDLCFASSSLMNKIKRNIIGDFPRSQHRNIIITIG